ncbi:hypothetical protein BAY60_25645 [Prauserella muralis]|uniref:Uncharacterized protein n=1 Tax=Prauserella muralis TaxID=588067 RepID=A0A2V4AQK5_9PSEU|nr:hypothetical protein BAY60_25645 [Prauserella muralis]
MGDHIHVAPIDDLVGHEVDGPHAECPCGPEVEHQDTDGAGDRWLVTHHSLDGREQAEDS